MSEQSQLDPAIIVIFGITGDLSQRKLLPALYHLFKDELLHPSTVILGITRRDVTREDLLNNVELCVNEIDNVCDPVALKRVENALRMHQMSLTDDAEYDELYAMLNDIEAQAGVCMNRLYYLSIPPRTFATIVEMLGAHGLNAGCPHDTASSALLVEKPFGYDTESARALISETAKQFSEEQLFRIDHYLAKETVQNILSFRLSDPAVEGIWNGTTITGIEIDAYEKIGIEGRVAFYEGLGALRDFIQSHLLQLLSIVTMELPDELSSESIHAAKVKLMETLEPVDPNVPGRAVRGQYDTYSDEVANPDSTTETYASLTFNVRNERWADVPMTLRTGKALAEKRTDVRLRLRDGEASAELIFSIQPDSGVTLSVDGETTENFAALQAACERFNASHPPANNAHPDAYERVLMDAIRGDHTLFSASAEVIDAWQAVEPVIRAWDRSGEGLVVYPTGAVPPIEDQ